MPFMCYAAAGTLCKDCHRLFDVFGNSVWDSKWEELPCGEMLLTSLTTDGTSLWGVRKVGTAHAHWRGQWWELDGGARSQMVQVSVSWEGPEVWGVDAWGKVLRFHYADKRWTIDSSAPLLKQVSVSCDSLVVWGADGGGHLASRTRDSA